MAQDPRALVGSPPDFLRVLTLRKQHLTFSELESYSQKWVVNDTGYSSVRSALESALIAHHCRSEHRLDLACYVQLMLVRSLFAATHGAVPIPEPILQSLETAEQLFCYYAGSVWEHVSQLYTEPGALVEEDMNRGSFITYPVKCCCIVEILSLLGLFIRNSNQTLSSQIAGFLSEFVANNEGATHPISDRWSSGISCCALLLHRWDQTNLNQYLLAVTKWVADRYDDDNLGLAGPHASPDEEVLRLLGSSFEHVTISRRPESHLASHLLDLCSVMEAAELYKLARNDFLAAEIFLPVLEFEDNSAQYGMTSVGQVYEPNMPYAEFWTPTAQWETAPHHRRGTKRFYPERVRDGWHQLVISAVLRDRHFVHTWRRFIEEKALGL